MQQKTIAAIKRYRTAKMAKLLARAYYLNKRNKKEELYTLLGDEMLDLGGVYVKFLQGVMLQSWMMKRWHNPDRLKIFERLDHEPINLSEVLSKNLGSKMNQIVEVQPQPFAAGSFGQVYYAKHADGTPIIIKVLRPMISETLKFDLKLLKQFWRATSKKMTPNTNLDFNEAFKDFAAQTLKETDYVEEARFAHEQWQTYKDHPKLFIPKTYLDLCTPQIIVQEYVGGISAAYLVELTHQGVSAKDYVKQELGSDLAKQLDTFAYELLWGTFHLPRIMGDPHPGNVKLLPDDRIALIDFGISARPSTNQAAYLAMLREYDAMSKGKFNMVNMFSSTLRFFGSELYRALGKVSKMVGKDIDLNAELSRVIKKNFELLSGGEDLEAMLQSPKAVMLFNRIANQNNRFGFNLKVEATEMLRATQSALSLIDSFGMYQQVMPGVYSRVLETVGEVYPELSSRGDPDMSAGQAIDVLYGWLERVANRDPALFQSLMSKLQIKNEILKNKPLAKTTKKAKEAVEVK